MLIAMIVDYSGKSSFDLGPGSSTSSTSDQFAVVLGVLAALSAFLSALFALLWLYSIFRNME
jgi:hypothetical protein